MFNGRKYLLPRILLALMAIFMAAATNKVISREAAI